MPEDNQETVQTNEQVEQQPVQGAEVTATPQEQPQATEGSEANGSAPEAQPSAEKPAQDEAERRRQAQLRRQREKDEAIAKARKEEHVSTVIAVLGGKNPYNGEPIEDAADVAVYETMLRIKNDGGDPIADYPKYAKKEAAERANQEKANADAEAARLADLDDFHKKYPGVSLEQLGDDGDFAEYADGKIGRKPLAEIYASYLVYRDKHENAGAERFKSEAAKREANAQASPGSLTSSGAPSMDVYTLDEIRKMSVEAIKADYEKVERSMRAAKK